MHALEQVGRYCTTNLCNPQVGGLHEFSDVYYPAEVTGYFAFALFASWTKVC